MQDPAMPFLAVQVNKGLRHSYIHLLCANKYMNNIEKKNLMDPEFFCHSNMTKKMSQHAECQLLSVT